MVWGGRDSPVCFASFCTSKTTRRVSRLLPLTLAGGFRHLEVRFCPRGLHHVATVEILRDVRATFSMESIQIDRAVALFVDFDDDRFLFHETSSSANSKPQLDLLALRRVDDLFALEHVTPGLGDGHGLPLLVDLRKAAQPPIVKADPAVVFTDERAKHAPRVTCETEVVGCAVQLPARDDDLSMLVALIAAVSDERPAFGTHLRLIAQFLQCFDEEVLFGYFRRQLFILTHMTSLRIENPSACDLTHNFAARQGYGSNVGCTSGKVMPPSRLVAPSRTATSCRQSPGF